MKKEKKVKKRKNKKKQFNIKDFLSMWSDKSAKLDKKDWIIMGVFVVFYLIIAFYNLGTLVNPQTFYKFNTVGDEVSIQVAGVSQDISKIRYYNGTETGTYRLIASTDGEIYKDITTIEASSVFAWEDVILDSSIKYLKIVADTAGGYIGEVQLYNKYGEKVLCKASDDQSGVVLDEMDTVPAHISYLNSTYFDEIYFARSAYEYIHGIDAMEWVHPPLGKLIMAIPILLFGMNTFSYRLMGTLAGVLMIPVIYIFAKRMFKNRKWATLAGALMTFDTFHFAQTRMGTTDSFLVLFIMLASLFMYQYIELNKNASFKEKIKNLFLSGLFMGCSIAVKWTGLYSALALAIMFFASVIYRNFIKGDKDKDLLKILGLCCIFFVLIPVVIYALCYLLFPNVVNYHTNSISGIIQQIKDMYGYHSTLTEGHPFSSSWYTWPVMYKPVWYYVGYYGSYKSTIVGIGNPAIWWFGILAFIYVLVQGIITHKKNYWFILMFILCAFIPYSFIGRAMFMYHYFPVLPFLMLAIVAFMKWITEKTKSNLPLVFYMIIVIVCFILFYFVTSGKMVNSDFIESLKWLSSWIF